MGVLRIPRSNAAIVSASISGYQTAKMPVAQRECASASALAIRGNSRARSNEESISTSPRRSAGGIKAFNAW